MKIIRDEELGGLMMIPLFADWGVRRCNVKGCTKKPNTIITNMHPQVSIAGFCEEHYQMGRKPEGANFILAFDEFDAFEETR